MYKFLLTLFLILTEVTIHHAQQFQRVLDPGRLSPGLDLDQKNGSEVGVLSFVAGPNLFAGGFLNLTTLNLKQGITSSYDYRITGTNVADGRATWWPSENSWLVGAATLNGTQNKALLKIAPDGSVIWSKAFGETADIQESNIGRVAVVITQENKAIIAGAADDFALNDGRNDLFVAKINEDGSSVWEKQLRFSLDLNADAALGALISLPDGSLLVSGTINQAFSAGDNLFLLKLDAQGKLIWAKQYGSPGNVLGAKERGLDCCVLPNGHVLMCGWVDDDLAFNQDGFLLETDETGNVIRSLVFDINGADFNLQINRVIAFDNDRVVFSAGAWENTIPTDALELNIMAEVQLDGKINWQRNYFNEILVGFGTPGDALITQNPNGGYLMLANDAVNFESLRPVLISTDKEGKTGCEKIVTLRLSTNKKFIAGNINPVVVNVSTNKNVLASSTKFNGYTIDLPGLDLGPDTSLCINEEFFLDASTQGADSYIWSTGEKTALIKVDSARTYVVAVSSAQQCFLLTDSIRIALKKVPDVAIASESNKFCEEGTLQLNAKSEEGASILWSTGEQSKTIEVETAGTYSVEATNSCGVGKAEIKVELPECPKDCPIFVPNAFTPNSDGTNDQFGPLGTECLTFDTYQFRIYSRWGELVFDGRTPAEKWDGSFNGRVSPADVYIWTLEYTTKLLGSVKKSGDVGLLR